MHSDEGCDTRIYDRITDVERKGDRHDVQWKVMDEFVKEVKEDLRVLKRMSVSSEVRIYFIMGFLMWAINHFLK